VVNLIEEGVDVGVRIGELPDSSLHAIAVGQVHRVVCASPAYLKANGVPRNPADLATHTIIAASPVSPSIEWKFAGGKKSTTVKLIPRLTVTNNDAAIVAALQGFGITRLMSYQIGPLLASGQLNAILQDTDQSRVPVHILHGEGGRAPAKVRVFVDSMVARLRSDKSLGYSTIH
jgi:DNA-binding transcriptional LysR family regulator